MSNFPGSTVNSTCPEIYCSIDWDDEVLRITANTSCQKKLWKTIDDSELDLLLTAMLVCSFS